MCACTLVKPVLPGPTPRGRRSKAFIQASALAKHGVLDKAGILLSPGAVVRLQNLIAKQEQLHRKSKCNVAATAFC